MPKGAVSLADFDVVDRLTQPDGTGDGGEFGKSDADLDGMTDNTAALLRLLQREDVREFTKTEAHELGEDHGDDLNASRQAVNQWINLLAEAGALDRVESDSPIDPVIFRLVSPC